MPTRRPDSVTEIEGRMGRGVPHVLKQGNLKPYSSDPNGSDYDYTRPMVDPNQNPDTKKVYPTQDERNAAKIQRATLEGDIYSGTEFPRDMIKFNIKVIDPENPTEADVMVFRAYLDDISDQYTAQYNSYKYNGRAENFYTYNSFDRNLNFKFRIQAQSRQEMKPLYQKLNYLVAQTAPSYKNGRMRTKYSRLTIGDWCNELPGFFESINLNWKGSYSWEIDSEERLGTDGIRINQLPQNLDVDCSFKPIHDFAPENRKDIPFILPHRGVDDKQRWYKES